MPGFASLRPAPGQLTIIFNPIPNRVGIPDRGIGFQVLYPIDHTGINEDGFGVSLQPDGTKLLVNSGTTPHLYELNLNDEHREIPIRVPNVTYDEGLKGFIFGWSWAGDDVLIGRSEIVDQSGHEVIEGRLYVFHMREQALARLDLSALNLTDTTHLRIVSIGDDLQHLRIGVGEREFAVKVDLKSPPKLLIRRAAGVPSWETEPAVLKESREHTSKDPANPKAN